MNLILTNRDTEILRYVFENRVATTDQIRRKFFDNSNSSAARRRVHMLCQAGYLNSSALLVKNRALKYFEATEKSLAVVWQKWPFEVDIPKFKSESPYHDLRLGEIRRKFEELSIFEDFYPENLLQSSSYLQEDFRSQEAARIQSDGLLLLRDAQKNLYKYAVELETSRKSLDRYERKLASYYNTVQLSGVIYICSDQQIVNALVKADETVRGQKASVLHYALESYVLESSGKMYFKNAKEHGIGLF